MTVDAVREYKKKVVKFCLANDILVTPNLIDQLNDTTDYDEVDRIIKSNIPKDSFIFNQDLSSLRCGQEDANKGAQDTTLGESSSLGNAEPQEHPDAGTVTVLFNYDKPQKKKEVSDFVSYFKMRHKAMEKILSTRQELSGILPISRILQKKDRETVSVIGLVTTKDYTKNGNIILTVEDTTGQINILISKSKPELFEQAKDIVPDEVLGIVGVNAENIIFANNVLWPDVPNNKELRKSPDEAYAVFLSDIHVGSNEFLEAELLKFISWLKGEVGNEEQRSMSKKIKYLFIAGDLVAGVGIYPGQFDDLVIKDIYEQYNKCAEYLKMIPPHIKIIVSPGNHDAMRIAEPQPMLYEDYAEAIYKIPNVIMVSNPGVVNIHSSDGFPGFDVLIYHGYSFDHYVQAVESIRNNGGYDRADLIMKFLLQRRHLAPTHASTLYVPNIDFDPLVIKDVPDFFITGHIHKCSVAAYRNVTTICGSCWEAKTAFQEKVGHHPEPCRVPIVNLKNRNVKIMKFGD